MRYLFVTFLFLAISSLHAQELAYVDQFENQILSVGGNPSGYTLSLDNGALQINGDGGASAWTAMSYATHDGAGNPILVDGSQSPKLYIRARGENNPKLRIDFQDAIGYVTNQSPIEMTLGENYMVYEFDFTNNLNDGAYGGSPCTSAPCAVDASEVQGLIMFVNAPDGGYTGTIDIDWISIGAAAGDADFVPHDIRYNQVSYIKDRNKLISIAASLAFTDLAYRVYRAGESTPLIEGVASSSGVWSPSREHVATVDLSSINEEGDYIFETDQSAVNFTVSTDGYDALCEASLKYYYYNRASQELTEEYAGPWARPLGHADDNVRVHFSAASADRPSNTIISSPKGWYDAGDYNKYIVNSGISTYTLLAAYEHYPDYYKNLSINIPEQGGDLPDILDEILWNLDWMLTMQDPADGGVYHKLTGLNFSGIIMPHQYTASRYVVQKTTAAALNFAAVTAIASRVFADFEEVKPGYSTQLIEASKEAYDWAMANPTIYYNQPSNVNTGEYGDGNVTDEFEWAAAELFITTREAVYRADINENQIGNGVPAWPYTAPLALISLAQHADDLGADINMTTIENRLLATAGQLRMAVFQSAMRVAMGSGNGDFVWGSNGQAGNQIMLLIRGYEITKDDSYLDAAYQAMDYLLGRNGTGFCYVSGFGDRSPTRPHHRPSEADNVTAPVPGMVAGGPNPGQQDGCSGYISNFPAGSYVDSWCSYASNEVTINWNAPMAYSINALRYYLSGLTSTTEEPSNVQKLTILPNPGSDLVHLPQVKEILNQRLEIVNLSGQMMDSISNIKSPYVDVSGLSTGTYIFRLSDGTTTAVSKWVKVD